MQSDGSGDDDWDVLETIQTFDIGTDPDQHQTSSHSMQHHTPPVLLTGSSPASTTSAPVSLLVESLVQQLCSLLERDSDRSKILYENVCGKLEQMKLIDGTWNMGEFDVMRSQYQKALYQLVQVAKGPDMILPGSSTTEQGQGHIFPLAQPVAMDWSRYHREFEELSLIASGGFGSVYRARNRLDGIAYAVKKVVIKAKSIDRVLSHLKEVKTLAGLHHVNIVPYKTAWLEPLMESNHQQPVDIDGEKEDDDTDELQDSVFSSVGVQVNERKKRSLRVTRTTRKEEYSDSVVFQNSAGSAQSDLWSHESTRMSFEATRSEVNMTEEEISSKAVCPYEANDKPGGGGGARALDKGHCTEMQPHIKLKWAVLYIQMAECQLTLRSWLDARNAKTLNSFSEFYRTFLVSGIERNRSLSSLHSPTKNQQDAFELKEDGMRREPCHLEVVGEIFSQLINGLSYIHARDIIHHDIKPSNIFISVEHGPRPNILVQLGDFGLACPLQQQHKNAIVGTPQYAAPEQLEGHCEIKSDIYSMGVILLELLICFSTEMERNKTVLLAKKENHFPEEVPQPYRRLIHRLLSRDVNERPTAFELTELFRRIRSSSADPVVEDLQKKLSTQGETIAELKAQVECKQEETDSLKRNLTMEMQSKDSELTKKDREILELKKKLANMEIQGEQTKKAIKKRHGHMMYLKKKLNKQREKSLSDTSQEMEK